jgi:hypothetical protein
LLKANFKFLGVVAMGCLVCPVVGWFGGWIGGYFGIQPPKSTNGQILSAVITASLISITIIALKVLFNVSLCVGGSVNLGNVARIGIPTVIMGIIYSIGVNYLLNRYVYFSESAPESDDYLLDDPTTEPCHCQCNKK